MFNTRTPAELGLSDVDFKEKAITQRLQAQQYLENTRLLLMKQKPFGLFSAEINMDQEMKEQCMQDFEGFRMPDPAVAIPAYMRDEETRYCIDFYVSHITLWQIHSGHCSLTWRLLPWKKPYSPPSRCPESLGLLSNASS